MCRGKGAHIERVCKWCRYYVRFGPMRGRCFIKLWRAHDPAHQSTATAPTDTCDKWRPPVGLEAPT